MKILKSSLLIFLPAFFFPIASASAAPTDQPPTFFDPNLVNEMANNAGYNTQNVGPTTLSTIVGALVFGVLSFLGVVFTTLIVYGGYRWLTARGNEQSVTDAKAVIRNAITGLAITVAAYGIWQLIKRYILG